MKFGFGVKVDARAILSRDRMNSCSTAYTELHSSKTKLYHCVSLWGTVDGIVCDGGVSRTSTSRVPTSETNVSLVVLD